MATVRSRSSAWAGADRLGSALLSLRASNSRTRSSASAARRCCPIAGVHGFSARAARTVTEPSATSPAS